jgi:hypothetical protein
MLGEEDAVRVIGPAGTSPPYIVGPDSVAEAPAGLGTADIFNEAAHAIILSPMSDGRHQR